MALTYTYPDNYLGPLVTADREARAMADIVLLGTFPATYTQRLVVLRAYIITCMESKRSPDDLFTDKLKDYRKEFADTLPAARNAQAAASSPAWSMAPISINLERA